MSLGGSQSLFDDAEGRSVTYRQILTVSSLARFQHVLMHVGNDSVGVHNQFSLNKGQLATTK